MILSFITFQHAAILPLLALAALPLILHLFSRAKPPVYHFSSNYFLEKIVRFTRRVRKPQDILLLILRTLLFISIVLMFSRPVFFRDPGFSGLFEKRNLVIVVDASASMGFSDGGQTRFASACAEASELVRGLSPRDRANIVFLKSRPDPVFPALGRNFSFLRKILSASKVSNEAGGVKASIREAVSMLSKTSDGVGEICVISDFQRSQWKDDVHVDVPEGIVVSYVKVGKGTPGNQAVVGVTSSPLFPLVGERVVFNCEIANYSDSPRRLTAFFKIDGARGSATLLVPAWGSATAVFDMNDIAGTEDAEDGSRGFTVPGSRTFECSIDDDDFADDNTRWGLLNVEENLRIGLVENSVYPAKFWKRALKSLPWIDLRPLILGEASTMSERLDFLMISGWKGEGVAEIKSLLESGVGVIASPSSGDSSESMIRSIFEPDANTVVQVKGDSASPVLMENAPPGKPFRLRVTAAGVDAFKLFSTGDYGDPVGCAVSKRFVSHGKKRALGKTLVEYTDGIPALTRYGSEETPGFFIWSISLDPSRSNFAERPQFLPFLAEFILSSRSNERFRDVDYLASRTPGQPIIKSFDLVGALNKIKLFSPTGENVLLKTGAAPTISGGYTLALATPPVTELGVYTWKLNDVRIGSAAVNFAVSESDFRTVSVSELNSIRTTVAGGTGAATVLHDGVELWKWLLVLAVILALSEGFLSFWAEKHEKRDM
ncbi:MAG: VWA domain-containing protein [Kiritimatiellaeota bacterium]|nr:VWA domain-containing protein [Kiritimatiellota bacterium]